MIFKHNIIYWLAHINLIFFSRVLKFIMKLIFQRRSKPKLWNQISSMTKNLVLLIKVMLHNNFNAFIIGENDNTVQFLTFYLAPISVKKLCAIYCKIRYSTIIYKLHIILQCHAENAILKCHLSLKNKPKIPTCNSLKPAFYSKSIVLIKYFFSNKLSFQYLAI